jgi:EAL domain-containing protein (putative c-di-GMP-specific phosphodiesterase class I)
VPVLWWHPGLRLVYQPVVELLGGHTRKVEALLRWPHPGGGLVPPSTFIPIAEASGLIRPLGEWVLREACRQAAAWRATGLRLKVAVNVSAAQLRDPGLPGAVRRALDEAGLEPGLLELELTESVFLDPSKELILETLRKVVGLGVTLAIDDFGTGYSSLARLGEFPVDVIKVDKSFVHDLGTPRGDALVAGIVTLSRAIGAHVIAEGVETLPQLTALSALGVDSACGYLLARPSAPEHLPLTLPAEASHRWRPGLHPTVARAPGGSSSPR